MALAAAPVEPGPLLRDALFDRMESTVLTSATLATRDRFEFIRRRLGVDSPAPGPVSGEGPPGKRYAELEGLGMSDPAPEQGDTFDWGPGEAQPVFLEVVEGIVPSPFDFRTQSIFCVPTDLPAPEEWGEFQRATSSVVVDLARITRGGIFVLFTSHRAMREVGRTLRAGGFDGRFPLFIQGEAPRFRLLEAFVRSGDGVLLGTSSFWEGVDVPGRPLRGLVLQKLPFRVPTEPVTEARIEAMEARGENAFWRYLLPLAALRLKQGFGRLIRSREDRGAILLLDRRILTRRYGSYLRASLPPAPQRSGPWSELQAELMRFYASSCPDPAG